MTENRKPVPTPSQTVGPFFSIGLCANTPQHLVSANATASTPIVRVHGRVLDGDGQGVPDAILEVWRADQDGNFAETAASITHDSAGVPSGFGRIATNENGEFSFSTIKPGGVRAGKGEIFAPHLVVVLFMRGLLRHLVTRMYFPDDGLQAEDPVIKLVPAGRRETLIAKASPAESGELWWEIHLQGAAETVFFDV